MCLEVSARHLATVAAVDQPLQELLWRECGVGGFNLHPHQFEAARFVAGVPID